MNKCFVCGEPLNYSLDGILQKVCYDHRFIEKPFKETDLDRLKWEVRLFCNNSGHTIPFMDYDTSQEHGKYILIVQMSYKNSILPSLLKHCRDVFPLLEVFDLEPGELGKIIGLVLPEKSAEFTVPL